MSELINKPARDENFRHNLLTNVSVLALMGYLATSQGALAALSDEAPPVLWIELGGQFERADSTNEIFAPPFLDKTPMVDRDPMIAAQALPPYSIGGEAKIMFEPTQTDWVLSASVLYGRSNSARHLHQQTHLPYVKLVFFEQIPAQPANQIYGDGQTNSSETHYVLDFQAGKDVGLGLFGANGKSIFSAGVRYAQFTSSSDASLYARPEYKLGALHSRYFYISSQRPHLGYRSYDKFRHTYAASFTAKRDSQAVGPTVSWEASAPVAGHDSTTTLTMDWGVNAAVLFGRQRTEVHHQTNGHYYARTGANKYHQLHYSSYAHPPVHQTRSRTVVIPNIGGFAGVSLKWPNAKVSLGYRGDFFFGALDDGIDTKHETNENFYGPFASISFGF
jgi:hypothetical protein